MCSLPPFNHSHCLLTRSDIKQIEHGSKGGRHEIMGRRQIRWTGWLEPDEERKGPKDHTSIRILHSGSKAQERRTPETMACTFRILVFMWSFGARERGHLTFLEARSPWKRILAIQEVQTRSWSRSLVTKPKGSGSSAIMELRLKNNTWRRVLGLNSIMTV